VLSSFSSDVASFPFPMSSGFPRVTEPNFATGGELIALQGFGVPGFCLTCWQVSLLYKTGGLLPEVQTSIDT
jgi:hypothetical protein